MERSKTRELDLAHLAQVTDADILIATETELSPENNVHISGYTSYLGAPANNGKIRLAILIKDQVTAHAKIIITSPMEIWLSLSKFGVTLGGVYRQWSSNNEWIDLNNHISNCLRFADSSKVIITGDFNLDHSRITDPSYSRRKMAAHYLSSMEAAGFIYAGPHSPTYFSHGKYAGAIRESTLDHVYTAGVIPEVNVMDYAATDHRPVICDVPVQNFLPKQTSLVTTRSIDKINRNQFCYIVETQISQELYSWQDPDHILSHIVSAIHTALDQLAPVKQVRLRQGAPLCLAKDTLHAMGLRDRAASAGDLTEYRRLRNYASRLVRRDRISSTQRTIERSKNDSKKLWNIARAVTGMGKVSEPSTSLTATKFNEFFIQKIEKIRKGIIPNANNTNVSAEHHVCKKFKFRYPSAAVIGKTIASLKNTGATGADGISTAVLKLGIPAIAGPLAHLVRTSFLTAKVPSAFKVATVTPVHKGKGKPLDSTGSYRPISILSALSKVLEKLAMMALSEYLSDHLPNSQFGFRPKRSTTAAIAAAHGSWVKAKSEGKTVAITGYDMSSAFDTLDIDVLINKLRGLGITGTENKWFHSYLTDRMQRVKINGEVSNYIPVKHGVPQGSILGPLLFLAMMAELPSTLENSLGEAGGIVGYADDIVVWAADKSIDNVKSRLETASLQVLDYAAKHYLAVNPSKTQLMWTGAASYPIKVGSTLVTDKNCLEMLGVKFDKALRPLPFLEAQANSAKQILGLTRRLSHHLPPHLCSIISSSLLTGKLGYAAAAVISSRLVMTDPAGHGLWCQIQVIINNAARHILRVSRSKKMEVSRLLSKSGLPSLNRLVVKAVAVETWKAIRIMDGPGGTPNPLGALIGSPGSGERTTRATSANLLPPPTKIATESMVWCAYQVWNSSEELRNAVTLNEAIRVACKLAKIAPL